MSKMLEDAIAKVRALPEEKQRLAAELLEELAEEATLTSEEEAAVREGLAQADRGEFASEAEVAALLRRPWD